MATTTPLNSDDEVLPKPELCLPFNEAISALPVFLQPGDEQERNELAMFLSQVDELHKPVAGKLSARSVFNFLEHMVKPATPSSQEEPLQATIPEHSQELTENIAFEIANSVVSDVDLHNTTISVLSVLQEVSWETKAALAITTFVLTFGDKGFNLCEKFKISVNEIQMFAKLKEEIKHQLEDNDILFTIVYKLIGSIVEFEYLPIAYMKSKDPQVKVARTQLIVIVYWIIKIIIAGATSHIIKLSSTGHEFDKAISALLGLPSRWSKILKDLCDSDHLKATFSNLQVILKKDVDFEAYIKIKEIFEQRNHSDNMEVLNALFSLAAEDVNPCYDCLRKRKVHLDELKGAYVLLFISDLENILPEVDKTKLSEFVDSFNIESENKVECNIVWMPVIDEDHSVERKDASEKSSVKPFMDLCYFVHQKLHQKLYRGYGKQKNFKGWYSVGEQPSISNEVRKLIRDDWKYKGEPMIVTLDPHGNIVHHNAIHMFYIWGVYAFPFTSEKEEDLWSSSYWPFRFSPIHYALDQSNINWGGKDVFCYGGESMEWIRSFTGMMREISSELGMDILMVYVGRSQNQELVRNVDKENLSHSISDQFDLWLFWKRIESAIYSGIRSGMLKLTHDESPQEFQRLLSYDKSNVGWVVLDMGFVWHGKVVLSTLKEFKLWREKASNNEGFLRAFRSHYNEIYRKMFPFKLVEFPTSAVKAPIETMSCPECESQMHQYTTFVCYHPSSKRDN